MLPLPQRLALLFGIVGHVAPSTPKSLFVMAAVRSAQRLKTGFVCTVTTTLNHRQSLCLDLCNPI